MPLEQINHAFDELRKGDAARSVINVLVKEIWRVTVTAPVMETVTDLDVGKLTTWMDANVEGFQGPLSYSKFPGGQSNPTYRVDAASG